MGNQNTHILITLQKLMWHTKTITFTEILENSVKTVFITDYEIELQVDLH